MSEREYVSYLNNISRNINIFFGSVVPPIGIFFNFFVILVYLRDGLRKKSNISAFYIFLAVYDILALLNSVLFVQYLPNIGINLTASSYQICKFLSAYRRTVIHAASWALTFITFDR
jgi:hypothetical protein